MKNNKVFILVVVIAIVLVCIIGAIIGISFINKNTKANYNIPNSNSVVTKGEENKNKEEEKKTFKELNGTESTEQIINSLNTKNFDPKKFDGRFILSYDKVTTYSSKNKEALYWNEEEEMYKYEKNATNFIQEGCVFATWDELFLLDGPVFKNKGSELHGKVSGYLALGNSWLNHAIGDGHGYGIFNCGSYQFSLEDKNNNKNSKITVREALEDKCATLHSESRKLESLIYVSKEAFEKWKYNNLGILIEMLGEPSDVNVWEITSSYKEYTLTWKYNDYTIEIRTSLKNESPISSFEVKSTSLLEN